MTRQDYEAYDYLIGMDDMEYPQHDSGSPEGIRSSKMYKLLEFAGQAWDIADPWYTGNFDATYEDVLEGCLGLLSSLV